VKRRQPPHHRRSSHGVGSLTPKPSSRRKKKKETRRRNHQTPTHNPRLISHGPKPSPQWRRAKGKSTGQPAIQRCNGLSLVVSARTISPASATDAPHRSPQDRLPPPCPLKTYLDERASPGRRGGSTTMSSPSPRPVWSWRISGQARVPSRGHHPFGMSDAVDIHTPSAS